MIARASKTSKTSRIVELPPFVEVLEIETPTRGQLAHKLRELPEIKLLPKPPATPPVVTKQTSKKISTGKPKKKSVNVKPKSDHKDSNPKSKTASKATKTKAVQKKGVSNKKSPKSQANKVTKTAKLPSFDFSRLPYELRLHILRALVNDNRSITATYFEDDIDRHFNGHDFDVIFPGSDYCETLTREFIRNSQIEIVEYTGLKDFSADFGTADKPGPLRHLSPSVRTVRWTTRIENSSYRNLVRPVTWAGKHLSRFEQLRRLTFWLWIHDWRVVVRLLDSGREGLRQFTDQFARLVDELPEIREIRVYFQIAPRAAYRSANQVNDNRRIWSRNDFTARVVRMVDGAIGRNTDQQVDEEVEGDEEDPEDEAIVIRGVDEPEGMFLRTRPRIRVFVMTRLDVEGEID